ncbi:MAG: TatD family hydrolase [Rikenellaceae bacterium]
MKPQIVDIHTHNTINSHATITSHGTHPWCADEATLPLDLSEFEGVDAVGEIGLDYCCSTPPHTQQRLFEAQMEVAQRLNKIAVIHCVRAYNETLSTLSKYRLRCVIFHGFIGSAQLLREITRRGYYVSYGERTFSSPKTIEALRQTPLDRLFLETDQSSVDIETIYNKTASTLGVSIEALKDIIYNNYKQIIR